MGYKKRKSKHAARVDHQNEILKVIQLFEKYPLLTSNARARYSVFLHCFKNRDSLSYEGLVEAKSKLQDMRDIAPATPSPLWPWLWLAGGCTPASQPPPPPPATVAPLSRVTAVKQQSKNAVFAFFVM